MFFNEKTKCNKETLIKQFRNFPIFHNVDTDKVNKTYVIQAAPKVT